jgi:hypothetical protein
MFQTIKTYIISYIYSISKQPIKLQELLAANVLYNEGMHLDGKKLGFRLKLGRAYFVFIILIQMFIVPFAFVSHSVFTTADCHYSILITMFTTGILFASFVLFRDWLTDEVARTRIETMWVLHFPLFSYKEYNKQIESIYHKSIVENVTKQDLNRYILHSLSS